MGKISSHKSALFWGLPTLLWQILFFYVPLSFLLSSSFVQYVAQANATRFTFAHYINLFRPVYFKIILRSFMLASTTVLVCLLLAYPVAYYLTLKMRRWKTICFSLLIIPFWTNFLLLVYAWYFLLERHGIINDVLLSLHIINAPLQMMNTTFAVYCGMFYCYLPFMLLPLYSNLEKFDVRLLEASYDLGANYWQTFLNITLPRTLPGIKTGALLVFVPTFGEFVIPALLGGDKNMYVGSVITHYFLTVRNVSIGSAFTCLSALVLVFLLGAGYLMTKIGYSLWRSVGE